MHWNSSVAISEGMTGWVVLPLLRSKDHFDLVSHGWPPIMLTILNVSRSHCAYQYHIHSAKPHLMLFFIVNSYLLLYGAESFVSIWFCGLGLAVDWIAENLYWTDRDRGVIMVSRLTGRYSTILLKDIDNPVSIAVNPLNGYGTPFNASYLLYGEMVFGVWYEEMKCEAVDNRKGKAMKRLLIMIILVNSQCRI